MALVLQEGENKSKVWGGYSGVKEKGPSIKVNDYVPCFLPIAPRSLPTPAKKYTQVQRRGAWQAEPGGSFPEPLEKCLAKASSLPGMGGCPGWRGRNRWAAGTEWEWSGRCPQFHLLPPARPGWDQLWAKVKG